MRRAKQKHSTLKERCAECKQSFLIGVVLPYYFSKVRKTFWLCPTCKGPVHERARNA